MKRTGLFDTNIASSMIYAALLCAGLMPRAAFADQAIRFNYQARLTAANGSPLTGSHTLFLSLWNGGTSSTASSGTQIFGETDSVSLADGVANVTVGLGTNTFGGALSDSMFDTSNDVYLQAAVDSSGNIVLPRTRLESVPFAARARLAGNGVPAGSAILNSSPVAPTGYTATGGTLSNSWITRSPMHSPRWSLGLASASNGNIYAIGGNDSFQDYFDYNEEYSTALDRWTTRTAMPTARGALSANALGGLIYAVGGIANNNSPSLTDNEAYNPTLDSWSTLQPLTSGRAAHASAVSGGLLYVLGGASDSTITTMVATVEAFDPGTNLWTNKAPMPHPRFFAAAAEVNGIIYVMGGLGAGGINANYNEAYDTMLNSWAIKTPPPLEGWYGMSGVAIGGRIYLVGGAQFPTAGESSSVLNTWIYDPISDQWSLAIPMPSTRGLMGLTAINGTIYAIGGQDSDNGNLPQALNQSWDSSMLHVYQKN